MARARSVRYLLSAASLAAAGVFTTGSSAVAADDDECAVSDIDYTVVGTLLLKDTQFGAADGAHRLGVGQARVRFEDGGRQARLMSYELDNHFTVRASFAFWSTTVVTDSHTSVATTCNGAAQGVVDHGDIVWSTSVSGYRSDGTRSCEGNVCGNFGAPPSGTSPVHEGSSSVRFKPFRLSLDRRTFTMPYALVSHSDSPRQTSYLSIAGRETKRTCVTQEMACL